MSRKGIRTLLILSSIVFSLGAIQVALYYCNQVITNQVYDSLFLSLLFLLRKTVTWQDHLNQILYIRIGCGTWPELMEENGRLLHMGISFLSG